VRAAKYTLGWVVQQFGIRRSDWLQQRLVMFLGAASDFLGANIRIQKKSERTLIDKNSMITVIIS
jgi:hypothetical protein